MIEQSTRIYTGLIAAILLFSVISSMPHYASAASSTGVTRTGVMISLYISPTSNTCGQYGGPGTTNCYDAIISVHNLHPSVPMVAKVNPSSGPGTAPDATHLNGYNNLKAAGITVLGYVPTHYAADSIASKEILIDDYKNWYNLDGIFFDEMANSGQETYYSTLTNYVKNVDGMKMTVCNPGTSVPASYIGTCDTIEIAESAGLPSLSTLQSRTFYPNYDKSNFFMLAHTTSSIVQTDVTDRMPYVGYEYMTDDVEPNPYDTIPYYFLDEVAYLDTGSPTPSPTPTSLNPPMGLATPFVSSSQISISWHAPLNDGGSPITGYKIESSTDSGTTWNIVVANTATTGTWYSNYHLLASTTYTYRVYSINSIGTSSPSSTVVGTTSKPFPASDSILLSIWKNDHDLQKLYPEAADGKTENLKQWAASTGWNQNKSLSALIPSGKFPLYLDQALLSIWVDRKDLQKLYPEVEQGNVTNLKKWALIQGWNEDKRLSVLVPQGKVPKY